MFKKKYHADKTSKTKITNIKMKPKLLMFIALKYLTPKLLKFLSNKPNTICFTVCFFFFLTFFCKTKKKNKVISQ